LLPPVTIATLPASPSSMLSSTVFSGIARGSAYNYFGATVEAGKGCEGTSGTYSHSVWPGGGKKGQSMMEACQEKPPFTPVEANPYLWYVLILPIVRGGASA
jgi:hypothetical protein